MIDSFSTLVIENHEMITVSQDAMENLLKSKDQVINSRFSNVNLSNYLQFISHPVDQKTR